MIQPGMQAPEFQAMALCDRDRGHLGDFKTVQLSDYKGKWVILFFYPADFTFV